MTRTLLKSALPLIGEFVAALAMLAILILSFAPVTPTNSILSSASASDTLSVPSSWCGTPLSGDEAAHTGPCHACRADAAKLPDAPCVAEPAFAGLNHAPFPAPLEYKPSRSIAFANGTRAPPVAV